MDVSHGEGGDPSHLPSRIGTTKAGYEQLQWKGGTNTAVSMTRAGAWSDAGDIMDQYAGYTVNPMYAAEVALRTSLTQDEAEGMIQAGIQGILGDLLYEHGDYGEAQE